MKNRNAKNPCLMGLNSRGGGARSTESTAIHYPLGYRSTIIK